MAETSRCNMGGEWRSITTPISLVSIEDNDTAIYGREVHPIYGGGTLYPVGRHHGTDGVWYDWERV